MWTNTFLHFVSICSVLAAKPERLVLDLNHGIVTGRHPYIQLLQAPNPSTTIQCSSQALIRLDFSGPYTKAKFELQYGGEPNLWSFLVSDSPAAYGFGGNHKYTSNCASVQVFNQQLRIYSNVLPGYRSFNSKDGHTLVDVEDNAVAKGSNLTVNISDRTVEWRAERYATNSFIDSYRLHPNRESLKNSPYLFTLSGQKTTVGPTEYYVYAAFNRVPLGTFHNGSGLCQVKVSFLSKRKEGKNPCLTNKHLCHNDAICRPRRKKPYKCHCKAGYVGDGRTICKDVDECVVNNGGCTQLCYNTQGSHYCACRHGYTLQPDGRTCKGSSKDNDVITKQMLLRFSVQRCSSLAQGDKGLFFKELKRLLLKRKIFFEPCEVHGLSLKCKSKKKVLVAYFLLEIRKGVVLTPQICNSTCLRCKLERRLQISIGRMELDKKFDITMKRHHYNLIFKSGKMVTSGVGRDCNQVKPYKNKQKRLGCMPGQYFEAFRKQCVDCPYGTYQPNHLSEIQFCIRCPGNKTTLHPGARDIHQCKETRCGDNLTTMSGIITSPNYPDGYPRNVQCKWNIYPTKGRNILVLLPKISLPTSVDCSDYLVMREAESPYSVATYYACESFDQPVAFVSRSKNLHIEFQSRGENHGIASGFKIFYVTFEEKYRQLVRYIVEDGKMYVNETNRRLLQDENLVRDILKIVVEPDKLHEICPKEKCAPEPFREVIEQKVVDYFDPLRKRRSLDNIDQS